MTKNKSTYTRNLLLAIPLTVLSLAPFAWIARATELNLDLKLIGLGALGWWIALLLRLPVMLSAKNLPQQKGRTLVTLISGPAEEIVRLVLLLILGLTFKNAYLIGLGWATIEVVYSIVQGFGMAALQQKTDAKAMEAKELMKTMGMEEALKPSAPFWGIVERVGANALHISLGLVLIISPWLALATIPLHSAVNYLFTLGLKRSLALTEIVFAAFGSLLFAACVLTLRS